MRWRAKGETAAPEAVGGLLGVPAKLQLHATWSFWRTNENVNRRRTRRGGSRVAKRIAMPETSRLDVFAVVTFFVGALSGRTRRGRGRKPERHPRDVPRQETGLAPPMFEPEVFRKRMYCIERKYLRHCWDFSTPPCNSAPGALFPPLPFPHYVSGTTTTTITSQPQL